GKSDAFLSQEGLEAVAVAFAQRSERLRSGDLAEETVFGRPAGARTHEDVNPAHVRIAVEQHRQRHLAEEAGDAGDEDLVAGEGSLEIEAQGCSFAAIPGFAEGPPPCSGSCRTPSCAARATSVITIGGGCISVISAERPCRPRAVPVASASVSAGSQPTNSGTGG